MAIERAQIDKIIAMLTAAASIYAPGSLAGLTALFQAGGKFNELLKQLKEETEATAPEVWAQISQYYSESDKAVSDAIAAKNAP